MHKSVLLHESIDGLELKEKDIFLDGTFGGGGHSKEALKRFPKIQVIGLDQDPEVKERSPEFDVRTENFRNLDKALEGIKPNAILLDLGFSSDQLDSSGRGLSFQKDEPLDMRLSGQGITAAEILNSWDEEAIELILRGFGEEKYSRRIADAIASRREVQPFKTTAELVDTIRGAVPGTYRHGKINPATRTFQALRIAVNEELTALEDGLEKGFEALAPGGRFAIISFHSLEDRIVKNFFRDKARLGNAKLINKKPITPSEEEIAENPRSRSAKLRIIEKI